MPSLEDRVAVLEAKVFPNPEPPPQPKEDWVEAAAPVATSDPLMLAWNEYKKSKEFANSKKWAVATNYDDGRPIPSEFRTSNLEGSMWAAFVAGFQHYPKPDAGYDKLVERSVGAMAIAEGEEGWQKIPIDCPMLQAVVDLRSKYDRLTAAIQSALGEK